MPDRPLDCLVVTPNSRLSAYGPLQRFAAVEPPLWAGLIAAFLRGRRYGVAMLDAEALDLPSGQIGQAAAAAHPRLIAVVVYGHQPSASTQTMPGARVALEAIRAAAPQIPTILIGAHPSALPERTLREEPVDFVCEGEGLITAASLLDGGLGDLGRVPGLWWWQDRPMQNRPASLIADLDRHMPRPAWELLPMRGKPVYWAHQWHTFGWPGLSSPYASVYTTLGCPYHCGFCMIQAPFRPGQAAAGMKETVNSYRRWRPETVVDQLEFLVKTYDVRNVKIADEMFVLNKSHVKSICQGIVERGLNLNLWAYARVDTVDPKELELMRQAGVRWLAVGIEAAHSAVRDGQEKGFSDDRIFETVRAIQAAGIAVVGNFIFGLEGDTLASMQATLDLAQALNCEWVNFYPAMAFPGSRLYSEAVRAKARLPETWAGYAPLGYDCVPFAPTGLTPEAVLTFRDMAFLQYFSGTGYQAMIHSRFRMGRRRGLGEKALGEVWAVIARGRPPRRLLGDPPPELDHA